MGQCKYCGRETNPNNRLEYTPRFCCLNHSELWHITKYGVSRTEQSLLELIEKKDKKKIDEWEKRTKSGEIMRIM